MGTASDLRSTAEWMNTIAAHHRRDWTADSVKEVRKLDLNRCWLSQLPACVGNLQNLTCLLLGYNDLRELPDSIGSLTRLTRLDLSGNQLGGLPDSIDNEIWPTRRPDEPAYSVGAPPILLRNNNELTTLPESIGNLTNLTSLSLSGNGLTTLPESIGNLTNLTSLSLSGNRLSRLPGGIGRLTNLTSLGLSGNGLSTLPDIIGRLTKLTRLDLSDTHLVELTDSIGNLARLTSLLLGENKLSKLPDSIGDLTRLTSLHLHNNQLSTLPNSIGKLTKLTSLLLGHNQLSTLPDSIGDLIRLTSLHLHNNPLAKLPDSIGKLTRLTTLDLSGSQLGGLPNSIGDLTRLASLLLGQNKLRELPDSIGELKSLREVDLDGNRLRTLPDSIGKLTRLTSLLLGHNQLSKLPDCVGNLRRLTSLHLHDNQLSTLPDSIGNLTRLTNLLLHGVHNQLSELPEGIVNLISLKSLDLGGNRLTELPEDIGNLEKLTRLMLRLNRLTRIPDSVGKLTNLTELDLSRNQLSELPDSFGNLTKLSSLDVRGNNIRNLQPSVGNLSRLTRLDLSSNQLGELPDFIVSLARLSHLLLAHNRLRELPDGMSKLTELTRLDLAGNQLSDLPDAIGKLTRLTSLDLAGNQLSDLPDAIGKLTRLKSLDLAGNQLSDLPDGIGKLPELTILDLTSNQLRELPDCIANLTNLTDLQLSNNQLGELPDSLGNLQRLRSLNIDKNPLPPEVVAAHRIGNLVAYLRLLRDEGVSSDECKLLFVGEGQVGKSSLFAALKGDPWRELPSTHGVDVGSFWARGIREIDLAMRSWDFGGQEGYRPAHQLFFTSPAVYLVVWKPADGPDRGRVTDWIRLIRRSVLSDVRVLVVSTHGGPGIRHSHLDQEALRDEFKEMIFGFYAVDSRERGDDLERLRRAIADAADSLPHAHRKFPRSWRDHRVRLAMIDQPYLPGRDYYRLSAEAGLDVSSAQQAARMADELGYWRLYEGDDPDEDLLVMKPDWLNQAMSDLLTDEHTRANQGLVAHSRIKELWSGYPAVVRRVFLRLMEQGELTYRVADPSNGEQVSLIGQLVPTARPNLTVAWHRYFSSDTPYTLRLRVTDTNSNVPILPENVMNRIIVLLHRWSLGAMDIKQAVHWSTGMLVQDSNQNRALITIEGNRIVISAKGSAPDAFGPMCAEHIRNYVERTGPWRNLDTHQELSCGADCPNQTPERGIFDYTEVLESRREGNHKTKCELCRKLVDNGTILHRAPSNPFAAIERQLAETDLRRQAQDKAMESRLATQVEQMLQVLFTTFDDIGRDGPRLITAQWAAKDVTNPTDWINRTLVITLWCEHSKVPVCLAGSGSSSWSGVYSIPVTREWWKKARPWIRWSSLALKAFVPIPGVPDNHGLTSNRGWEWVEGSLEITRELGGIEDTSTERTPGADGSTALRQLHELIKKQDPDFAGLRRVIVRDGPNKGEYRWVLPRYANLYEERLPGGLS